MDRIGVVGTSYRTTQVENLASATLPGDFPREHLVDLARLAGFSELVYLGTCNRVEFYFRSETRLHRNPLLFHLRRSLADLTGGRCRLPGDDELYILHGTAAVRHLFRVTSSLDAMMVGEAQISGQAKEAHEVAHGIGLLGGILDQTFHEAFHLAKRIRTETELTRRPVSLVTLVERRLHDHLASSTAPVLIVGAGEVARQALRLLRNSEPQRQVIVSSRTLGSAEDMVACDSRAEAVALESVIAAPPTVGLIVAATASETIVLEDGVIAAVRDTLPADQPLLLVDLAMPPNLAPEAREIPGVSLHGIEEMREEAEANRSRRMAEMGQCEELVEHQMLILRRRLQDRALSPAAKKLHHSFTEIAERAVDHSLSKDLSHLGDRDREAVERLAEGLVKRLVQVPLRGLKGAAWNHSDAVIDNFIKGLDGEPAATEDRLR